MLRWLRQMIQIFRLGINRNPGGVASSGWKTSFGISAVLHVAGLGLLAFVAMTHSESPGRSEILAEFAAPQPESTIHIDSPVEKPLMMGSSAGGRPGASGPVTAGIETARRATGPEVAVSLRGPNSVSPLDLEPRLPPKGDLADSALGKRLGKGLALGGGFGRGVGEGTGNGSGSQFFELETAGAKFVYVIDGSGSMTEPHSEARNRLERVKIELIRSIGGLPDQMEFFVIFFNTLAVPMPAEKLQPATLANKTRYLEWCAKIRGGGGTDPRAALKQALELRPDVIYFLTDGVFKDDVAGEVTTLNTRGVSIHTFCFGDAAGEALLKSIAQQNSGTYKFIP